jgi:hypothetical protein
MSTASKTYREQAFRRIQIRRGISIGFVALAPLLVLARGRGRNSVGLYLIVLIVAGHGPLFVASFAMQELPQGFPLTQ